MAVREAELEGRGYQTWAEARTEDNFAKFAPVLEEIVALKKEIAAATHPHLSSYDANVDAFERGMTVRNSDKRTDAQ
jgi:carboxypeptidase Taq